ncbi:MAG: methionine--tRNA ligase subunit beta [Candidatus Pacebacteria bacterium]|nr:methionine--tRNA ligase subunit beta [Candidatus Paceibacterota bacterium]MDD5012914.1 methionine--tRNA ligase subunit beta [Candidatus Paceibacterota bacterium]MDD5752498.1 methionine--tRNA ligase subunit beta [Candidatus Paceibacterota bacterium]
MINFEEFKNIDLRIAKIISVSRIEESEKLLKIEVELGEEKRIIVAGIANYYSPEELINKNVVIVANLEPRLMFGTESQGMILAVKDEDKLSVLVPEKEIKSGLKIT